MEKLNENEILDKVIDHLVDYAEECYGAMEQYQYNDLMSAINDLIDHRNGFIQDFNDMGTSARCYFIDTCDILEINLD